jgi:hypothetical protein
MRACKNDLRGVGGKRAANGGAFAADRPPRSLFGVHF